MRSKFVAGLAAFVLTAGVVTILLWPDGPAGEGLTGEERSGSRLSVESPAGEGSRNAPISDGDREMAAKQRIVERDAALTARLCSMQCSADLAKMAGRLSRLPETEVQSRLGELRAGHPRLVQISWVKKDGSPVRAGGLPAGLDKELGPQLREAELAVHDGRRYDYGPVESDGEHFAVLGVPGRDGEGIVGVVRQSVTGKVKKMQTENLRLVPYPREGRYQVESVDSRSGRDITVDHGEENGVASHYHKQEVVVKFARQPDAEELDQISRDLAISEMRKTGYAYVFQSERSTAEEMIDYFRKSDNIVYVEPHWLYMTNGKNVGDMPNDLLFEPYQWNLPIIDTIPGWSITTGNEDIIVAVIDTGVDLEHADLKGRFAEGMNFVSPGDAPTDDVGHGTHVAGVISAVVNNAEGVAGMTWHDRVMPIKVLDASGAGSAYAVAQGIIWATDNGAKVINLSLGNYAESEFLHDAVRYAYDHDVVLVAATGNDNTDQPGYPAAYPEVLGVSATDGNKRLAEFSNYGDYVDVVAPGVNIASTYPDGQYAALSGTSMASPHAAALAALIRSVNPLLRNTEVMDIMRRTAADLGAPGKDPLYGYGQIDVAAALEEAFRLKQSIGLYAEWLRREIEQWRAAETGFG